MLLPHSSSEDSGSDDCLHTARVLLATQFGLRETTGIRLRSDSRSSSSSDDGPLAASALGVPAASLVASAPGVVLQFDTESDADSPLGVLTASAVSASSAVGSRQWSVGVGEMGAQPLATACSAVAGPVSKRLHECKEFGQ